MDLPKRYRANADVVVRGGRRVRARSASREASPCPLPERARRFADALKCCCMQGSSGSSSALSPTYLPSSIIDGSHCTNFICCL